MSKLPLGLLRGQVDCGSPSTHPGQKLRPVTFAAKFVGASGVLELQIPGQNSPTEVAHPVGPSVAIVFGLPGSGVGGSCPFGFFLQRGAIVQIAFGVTEGKQGSKHPGMNRVIASSLK